MNWFKYWRKSHYPQVGDVWTDEEKDHSAYRPEETYSDWKIVDIKGKYCIVEISTATYGSRKYHKSKTMDCSLWYATFCKWLRPESVK